MSQTVPRRGVLAPGAALAGSDCALPIRVIAVPRRQTAAATAPGLPNERVFSAQGTAALEAEFAAAMQRRQRALGVPAGRRLPTLDLLAISGGGEDGAFGAGLFADWTEHGACPVFGLVTGVSTGAPTAC